MGHGLVHRETYLVSCTMQVCSGEATAAKITSWAKTKYTGKLRLKVGQASLATVHVQLLRMHGEHAAEVLQCATDQKRARRQ